METPDQATTEATQTDPSTSYLEQLVGEGKKYSNPEELAKAYFNADGFINHLKNETGSLREELDKRMTLEELLAEKQQEQQISTEPKAVEQPQETPVIESQPPEKVDLDLGAEVRRILTEESARKTADSNLETVMNSLMSTYGDADKAREEILRRSEHLGVDSQTLLDVARKSPKAFFELAGLSGEAPKAPAGSPSRGDVNSAALATQRPNHEGGPKEGTYEYYEQMRRDNPRKYFSAKTQNEIMKAAIAKGDTFYS